VGVVAVEVGPGVVGGVVALGREEGVGVGVTTMKTPMGVPVVVQDVAVAAVVELGGDEEVHHRHHPPGHRPPQTTCWTRTFSSVSPFYTFPSQC